MSKICGIELSSFTAKPSPLELGKIVAHWDSEQQAEFFLMLGEELRNCCGGKHFMQWQYISNSIKELEEKLCDGSASQLIDEIHQRLSAA